MKRMRKIRDYLGNNYHSHNVRGLNYLPIDICYLLI